MLKTALDLPSSQGKWRDHLSREAFGQVIAMGVNRSTPVITPVHFIREPLEGSWNSTCIVPTRFLMRAGPDT
jgi:hypothetical protein